jgi:GT2 family glycosyltransferase
MFHSNVKYATSTEYTLDLKNNLPDVLSIIIIHKDKPEFLNICLQSIVATSSNNNYEIIVVDNNSGSESQQFLDELDSDIKIIRSDKNIYWSAAANLGMKAADPRSKYVLFLHADVVVLNPAWLDLLMNICETNNAGMVGVESGMVNILNQNVNFIQEWCVLFSKLALEKIGDWPEELPLIGNAFIMTLKAQLKGYKPQVIQNNVVHHYRVFGVDVSEYERIESESKRMIPQVYMKIAPKVV